MLIALVAGAAVLTGCNNSVMSERKIVTTTDEQGVVKPMDASGDKIQLEEYKSVPSAKVAPEQLPKEEVKATPAVVPAPVDEVQEVAVKPVTPVQTVEQKDQNQVVKQNQSAAPQARQTTFAPMNEKFSDVGISSPAGATKKSAAKTKSSIYVVKRGDTLSKIAKKHGVKLADLCKANKIQKGQEGKIYVGRKLTIPAAGSKQATSATKAKSNKKSAVAENGVYIVRRGDTPEGIARRHRVKVADFLEANNLTESSARRLRIGQKLVVPGRKVTTKKQAKKVEEKKVEDQKVVEDKKIVEDKPIAKTDDIDIIEKEETKVVKKEENKPSETTATAKVDTNPKLVVEDDSDFVSITEEITIEDFAKKHGLTVEKIRSMNVELGNVDKLTNGTVVFIPKK